MNSRFALFTARFALVLALAAALLTPEAAEAKDRPFSRIIVLGDSLSDTGNFFRLTGGLPPPPNFEGRACNGPLWVEYLARGLGMKMAAGDNLAVFGATTGSFNLNNGLNGRDYPGLEQQVADLLSEHPVGLDPNALYVLWVGANDLFLAFFTGADSAATIAAGVHNTVRAIETLSAAGARNLMVLNLPNLGLTPLAQASGQASVFTQWTIAYNGALTEALQTLENGGIPLIEVDSFAVFQMMATRSRLLGFTNVTDPFLPDMQGDERRFLFWDEVHPTTRAHQVVAAVARLELNEHWARLKGGQPNGAAQ